MRSSLCASVTFFDQTWPKVNSFCWRDHQMQSYRFRGDGFSLITFLISDTKMKITPSCTIAFASPSRFEKFAFWHWKINFKISPQVSSAQNQVMTKVGQYAYLPKQLDEPSRLASFACLYLHHVATYWQKRIVTSFDLMTSPRPPTVSCTRTITDWASGHDPERIRWFRLVYAKLEGLSHFPEVL